MSSEQIWFKNPKGFITKTNYNVFFPTNEMTFVEQLNCLLRLSLYFCVIIFIIKHNVNIFFIVIFVGLFTFLLYSIDEKNTQVHQRFLQENNLKEDKWTKELCVKPTKNNPFMNVLMSDYALNPGKKKACDIQSKKIKQEINDNFNEGLYRDVSDIFSKIASDRQFITNPSTTIPNDRENLTNWLYGSSKNIENHQIR